MNDREMLRRCQDVLRSQAAPDKATRVLLAELDAHLIDHDANAPKQATAFRGPADFAGPTLDSPESDLGSPADYAGLRRRPDPE